MAGTHHQACSHPGMSRTPGIVYWVSIGDRETLRSPDLTFRWIRNVGGWGEGVDHCADLLGHPTTPQR
jgi:hypothetical protein